MTGGVGADVDGAGAGVDGAQVEAVIVGAAEAVVEVLPDDGGGVRATLDDRPKAAASAFEPIEPAEEDTSCCILYVSRPLGVEAQFSP